MACYQQSLFKENQDLEKFKCPITFGIIKNPIRDQCGHVFCKECFEKKWNETKKCPVSQQDIGGATTEDHEFNNEINALLVHCQHGHDKCNWTGPLSSMQDHLSKDCSQEEVKCKEAKCEMKIKRGEVAQHNAVCEWTVKPCQFCKKELNDIEMEEHHNTDCQEIEIDCEKRCISRYQRKHKDIHERYACELIKHDCHFRNAGCYFSGTWEEMGRHASDAIVLHGMFLEQKLEHFEDYKKTVNKYLEVIEKAKDKHPDLVPLAKELDDLEDKEFAMFKGEFHQKFSSQKLIFESPRIVKSQPGEKNQLLFINRPFHEKHRIIFTVDKYNPAHGSCISVGLTKKGLHYERGNQSYDIKLKDEFKLISDKAEGALSEIGIALKQGEDYMISYNDNECEFVLEVLNPKDDEEHTVATFEFPVEFFEWQPVFILSNEITVTLMDFTDWNQY